jgi:predicted small metal-binding protein
MGKILRCKDVGMDCDAEIRAETEEEILKHAAEHAEKVHDITKISEEQLMKVKEAIRDE